MMSTVQKLMYSSFKILFNLYKIHEYIKAYLKVFLFINLKKFLKCAKLNTQDDIKIYFILF